jgi:DNA-binding PadR family transcriptional regulator
MHNKNLYDNHHLRGRRSRQEDDDSALGAPGAGRQGPPWGDPRDEMRGGPFGGGRRGGRRGGGPRGGGGRRARRGDARLILLDALRDGPKHGYEIIKALEARSDGAYVPSPGTVYPTLQFLEDQGLVRARAEGERRIFELTEAGRQELDDQAGHVNAFWQRFAGHGAKGAAEHEVHFLKEELEQLDRIVWGGLRPALARGDAAAIRRVRAAVEECQNRVREIIAAQGTAGDTSGDAA